MGCRAVNYTLLEPDMKISELYAREGINLPPRGRKKHREGIEVSVFIIAALMENAAAVEAVAAA